MRRAFLHLPAVLFAALLLASCILPSPPVSHQVIVHDIPFAVDIADSDPERSQGLSHRPVLPKGRGMLFVFEDEQVRHFWMKDMRFPLDIAFIDQNQQIINIHHNAQRCTRDPCLVFSSTTPARYVLEVNAGALEGIQAGDVVNISIERSESVP